MLIVSNRSRGVALLAALAFVALLGTIAVTLQSVGGNKDTKYAYNPEATVAALDLSGPTAGGGSTQQVNPTAVSEQKCKAKTYIAVQKQAQVDVDKKSDSLPQATNSSDGAAKDDCISIIFAKPTHKKPYANTDFKCVGKIATVSENISKGAIESYKTDRTGGTMSGLCKTYYVDQDGNKKYAGTRSLENGVSSSDLTSGTSVPSASDAAAEIAGAKNTAEAKNIQDAYSTNGGDSSALAKALQVEKSKNGQTQDAKNNIDYASQLNNLAGNTDTNNGKTNNQILQEKCQAEGSCSANLEKPVKITTDLKDKISQVGASGGSGGIGSDHVADLKNQKSPTPEGGGPAPEKKGGGTFGNPGGGDSSGGNDPLSGLGSFMKGFAKGMSGGSGGGNSGSGNGNNNSNNNTNACTQQYSCTNSQLTWQSSSCQTTNVQTCQYGCNASAISCASAPAITYPYGKGTDGAACTQPPTQPAASACTSGSWQQSYAANTCVNGWICQPATPTAPTAQISCQPPIVDLGLPITISYTCSGSSVSSAGIGFTSSGLTGSSTVSTSVVATTSTMSYGIICNGATVNTSAQCNVQLNKPSIVLVTNPSTVTPNTQATIGWITTGMRSCVISSPDLADFTAINVEDTRINGAVRTPYLQANAEFDLTCATLASNRLVASTTIAVGAGTITMNSTIGVQLALGATSTISWHSVNPISNAAMSLWIVDIQTRRATKVIAGSLPTTGSYNWQVPSVTTVCDHSVNNVCASDLVSGHQYTIEALMYTPSNAYIGDGLDPGTGIMPTYTGSATTSPFTMK